MASHESAVKAHRQSLVKREANRNYRSRLRGALRSIRTAIDSGDPGQGEGRAAQHHLARRQDGRQEGHPPQRRGPLQVAPGEAGRQAHRRGLTPARWPAGRHRRLHSSTTSRSSSDPRISPGTLQVEIRAEQRVDGRRNPPRVVVASLSRTNHASCPRTWYDTAPASSASASWRSASRGVAVLDGIRDRPVVVRRLRADDFLRIRQRDLRLARRVEHQPLDVAAQPDDVDAGALGDEPRRRRLDDAALTRRPPSGPSAPPSAPSARKSMKRGFFSDFSPQHSTTVACL